MSAPYTFGIVSESPEPAADPRSTSTRLDLRSRLLFLSARESARSSRAPSTSRATSFAMPGSSKGRRSLVAATHSTPGSAMRTGGSPFSSHSSGPRCPPGGRRNRQTGRDDRRSAPRAESIHHHRRFNGPRRPSDRRFWRAAVAGRACREREEERDSRLSPLPTYARHGGLRQAPGHAAQSPP
jgi:hypothetical protein